VPSEKKLVKKAEKSRKKAAKKEYDRNHAQLKRQQAMHGVLLAAQVKRGKKQSRRKSAEARS
jgi:hypothetical protein